MVQARKATQAPESGKKYKNNLKKKRNMNKGCTDQRCPVGLCGPGGHNLCWVGWGFMGFVLMVLAYSIQIFCATSK